MAASSLPLRRFGRAFAFERPQAVPLWLLATGVGVALLTAALVSSGRPLGYAVAIAVVTVPLLALLALMRPYLFPYALYVALIPFDNLLHVGSSATLTRVLGLAAGGALLLYITRVKRLSAPSPALWAWGGYAAWAAASTAWAVSPDDATRGALQLAQLVALYGITAIAPIGRSELRLIAGAIVLGGVAAGLFGIWQFRHNDVVAANLEQQSALHRLVIQIGDESIDVNHFADALLLPIMLATVGLLRSRGWALLVWGAAITLMLVGIYLSASREAFIAIAAGLIAIAVLAPRFRVRLGFFGLFIAGIALGTPWVWMRFGASFATGGSGRNAIWRTGLTAARDHWLLGVGMNNFRFGYDEAYLQVYAPYSAGWSRPGHDIIVQNILELGIIGTALLLIAFWATWRSRTRGIAVEPDSELADFRTATGAAFISLSVAAIFIDLLTYKYFWLALSTMAQVHSVGRRESMRPSIVSAPSVPSTAIAEPPSMIPLTT